MHCRLRGSLRQLDASMVCRTCGSTELYTKEHDTLPIGPEWGTELFEVPGTPYR